MGLLVDRRMKREGQTAGSNWGRNPVRWGRKTLGMAPDPRGSPEGYCLGCSSPMDWVWLKTGCQGNVLQGSQAGPVCG